MGLTGTTLAVVALAIFGSAAALCPNVSRPAKEKDREGCDYYCWDDELKQYEQGFFVDNEKCFYKGGYEGYCKDGACNLTKEPGSSNYPEEEPTEPPRKPEKKTKKPKEPKPTKKPKEPKKTKKTKKPKQNRNRD